MKIQLSIQQFIGAILLASLASAATSSFSARLHAAQEHDAAYPQTRTWLAADFKTWDSIYGDTRKTQVFVIDTAGVCLYVLQADAPQWDGVRGGIAAVPKTQLPKGAGCQ
jgi:hypothetical protein